MAEATQTLAQIPMLESDEQQALLTLGRYQGAYQVPTQSIHKLFEHQVDLFPNHVAISYRGETLTYKQLNERANALAHTISAMGVEPGSLIGVCIPRCPQMMVAILAILKTGAAYVPLDPTYPASRIALIIQDAALNTVLSIGDTAICVSNIANDVINLDDVDVSECNKAYVSQVVSPDTPAYVNYTSGTTGKPKGVVTPHRGVCRLVRSPNYCELNEHSRVVHFASISFDAATFELWGPLLNGGRCIFYPEQQIDLPVMNELLADNQVDTLFMTTGLFNQWSHTKPKLPALKRILFGGEVADKQAAARMLSALPDVTLVNVYGPTENTTFTSFYEVPRGVYQTPSNAPALPIGSVLNGSELIVVARDGSLTPQGGIGELLTGGDGVALGYLNQQKMTEERFIRHPVSGDGIFYKTGDLVRYNDTGELDYIGRADNQIKLRGYRIELGEIEHVLVECEEVESALVLLKTSSTDLKQLIAYVCVSASHLANSMSNLIAQLQDKLTANLPKYMIPAALVPLTNWPLTSTGKINREALPEPELAEVQGTFVEANTQLEGKIRELVARLLVLDEEKISMTANFFELGGHSLLATRLVSELEAVIGKRVPIKAVFEHVSLRSFASYIEQIEHVQTDTVETADRNTAMNASYAQQRLWFLDHLQGGSPEYNISEAIELQGGLQLDAVRKALQALVARHEVLRTTYTHANDQVLCVIHPEIALPLEIVDLSTETPAQQNQAINELVAKQAECVFDLSKDMPLRVMLVKKSAQNTVLVWTMHHIATDGWSLSLLIREFTTFYSSYLTGEKCELPELEMQYVDYAHTQRTRFEHGEYKSSVAYWQTYLDGIPDVHSLPLDFPRPVKQRHEGEVYTQQINPTQLAQLNALASAHQVTLFMLLETAFALVLSRFSGETDIVIGTPIAGREHKSFELIIGLFVNTLVNRINTDGIDTFDALLAQVKSNTLAAYEHQQVPFDAVVEAVNPERSSAYNPLCQIKFVLQNFASGELVLPHVTIRPYDDTLPTQVHFDLDLTGTEREGALLLEWTFKKSLFKRATIARMASALNAVLDTICKTPSCQLRHIEMVPAIEKAALLQQGQGESLTYDTQSCLVRQIEEQVEKTPHAIAVCCDELSLTYEVLNRQANKLAWALDESGVEQGECVGLYLERSIAFSIALLAVQKLGVTYVVLPTGHDIERINRIVKDAQIEVVLQAKSHELTAIGGVDTFFIDEAEHDIQWLCEYQEDNPRVEISPSDIAYILYTSGSTGTPKGVEVTQQGLLDYCQISAQKHYRGNGSLVATATTFDLSIPGLYVPLMRGGCVNLVSAGDELTKLAALLSDPEMSGHFIRLTPSHIQGVLPLLTVSQSSSEHVFVIGGERFDVSIAKQMQTCFVNAQIYNHYGPTETVVGAVCYDVSANIATLETEIPIGTALPNTSVYVLDQHMDLTPIGVPGEIYIGGTRVAKGYLNQPEMTDARFIDSPFVAGERLYRTGDRARLLPDGNIAFISRMDDQVKIRGYRIELGEIEQQLLGHSAVSACVAHVWEEAHQAQLVAYVVLDNEVESQVLQTYLQAKLPHYMIPSAVVTLASLPLSANGKVNRKQLTKPQNNVSSTGVFSSPTEVMLADIWRRALNIEQLSPSDDFFALGGHSLIATRVVSDITKLFNKPITVSEFFDCRTLHKMAKHIDAMERKDFKRIPHCLRETDLALSFSQQRLWFIDQLEKNSSQYNMPMALMLSGDLNVGALHAALNALVNRHEVLRTCYHKKQGQPIQVILPEGQVAITQEDLQAYDEQEQLQRLSEIEANEWLTGFDLQSDMMFRAKLVQLAPTRHALFITLHHIASDGWSNGILVKEFAHLYQCFHSGTDSQLAPLPIQYADYAMWQRQQLNAHELDKQLSYWSSQLAELPIVHGLPLDKPRPQQQQFDAQSYDVCLSEAVLQRLQQFALDNGATLFMLLEVLFAAVVARFSNEDDIVIGTPISGRNHKDVEPLIGLFVNTLLLRTDLSDNPSFVDLLQQSKETSLAAYAHQDVPFDMLVDKLNPDRQLNHAALFQILFSMRNNEQVSLSLPALTIEDIPAQQELSKFDLQLSATESKQGLELSWRYATSIFERTTITRLSDAYNALLSACVEDPQAPVKSIPLISEAAHENIVAWELGQQVPCTTLLHHAFEQQAEAAPQRIALSDGSMALDYHTVNKMANQLAHYLCAQNVKPEDKIALLLNRSCMSIVCILAILKAGAAYVPIDTASPNELTEQIVADSDSVLLLCDADISLAVSVNRVNVKDLDLSTFPADNPLSVEVDATQLAYVIYTSGSSGKPKGVMVEHASLANLAANLGPKGIDHTIFGGCFALSATYAFDSSIKALVQLAHGAEIYVLSDHQKMNISALKHLLLTHERSITVMDCTPSLLEVWLGQGLGEYLPNLLIGGEAISDALWQRLVKWQAATGKKALNVYGPTECTVDTTWALIKGQKAVIGRPLNNVRIYVLDAHMQRVPVGVSGELYIGGAGIARGYINNAQLTQQQFVIDPFNSHSRLYKTGDKVRWSESGCLEFIGRIDNQVKIRGYRIELAHIEQQLLCVKKVTDAVVHVLDIQGSQQIVAYVVLDSHEQNIQGIEQSLARHLPSYMLPSAIIAIQKIPLTRNGKVDYDALPLPDYDFSAIALLPAQTPTEKALAGIWKNTLGVEEVGRNSGFFELGGHSIMAIKLVSDIASELGKTVTVRDVFENQQLEAFASYLDTLRVEYQQHISAVSKDEPLVLSYAQQRIWFIDQLEGGSAQYNISMPVKLVGELHVPGLQRALSELVKRHEILRTVYLQNDEGTYQFVTSHYDVPLVVEDISALTASAKQAALRQAVNSETEQAFDLSSDMMIRARLIKLNEGEHALVFTIHHIATDGWSNSLLLNDFANLYQQQVAGEKSVTLPEMPIQYADFAFWQRTYFSDEHLTQQLNYWKQQLASLPTLHTLPTDKRRPAQQQLGAQKHLEVIDRELLDSLQKLATGYDTTLFTVIHTAFSILLGRLSGEDDIVIGSPIAGRNLSDIQNVSGCFINTLVLRTSLAEHQTFEAFLQHCKAVNLDAMSHQDLPFDLLVDELNPERSLSHAPVFQILLSMQNYEQQTIELPELRLQKLIEQDVKSKFDIQLVVGETEGQLEFTWVYATALFNAQTMTRFAAALTSILQQVAQDVEFNIRSFPLFDDVSRSQTGVRELANRARTLIDYIEAQVLLTPNNIAVRDAQTTLTYHQLNEHSNRLASALLAHGVSPEQKVGVCLARSTELLIALLAVQKIAATYVMLSIGAEQQRLEGIIEDAEIQVVLHDGQSGSSLPHKVTLIEISNEALRTGNFSKHAAENPEVERNTAHSAYILYTSGSTGKPKGVEISQLGLNDYCQLSSKHHYPGDGSVVASAPVFDLTIPGLYVPLLNGGCVHLLKEGNELNDLALFLAEHDDSSLLIRLTPSHVQGLLPLIEHQIFIAQHVFVIGGERFAPDLAKRLQAQFAHSQIINHYGPTETVVGAMSFDVTSHEAVIETEIPIGKPLPNTEVMILDTSGARVPTGVPGELCIASPRVAKGYLNRPQLNQSVFVNNPYVKDAHSPYARMYRTGDKVRELADGNIAFMGRLDRQVKVRGFRVELAEIELQISAYRDVEQAAVKVFEEVENTILASYLVVKNEFDERAFMAFLKHRLPSYMIPTSVQVIDAMPLNNNGKVNLHALARPQNVIAQFTPPETDIEHRLVSIWQDVLQRETVSITANFFDLGGNSLLGTRVINAVQKEFDIELPLRSLFEQSDIRSIATLVEALTIKKRSIQMALAEEQQNMEETEW
ncbi:amino acid adenylation domain-containing protein [Pseudoalteromonas sp. SMS1]|uniref:non-ribosomal peptide synthetase n=1 Tax=Pseudoalteromonas sp. SMS1 TaxID=2908894 RepID=UPI001F44EE58|nr:non-ribosomal peptide synthetase [Pseudoalteromonas sp. SMS1]MCF2856185.1 amino acid adenylation domain-containing protein [Pseudoalteromonas sp. SMS1]